MPELKITIVVCTYNRAGLLKEALQSLLDQTLDKSRFEVVVVDNNSSDSTQDVVRPYVERYSNLRYVNEPRQGLSVARNRGYAEAQGEYVAYIDDDAMALPDWIERILNAFKAVEPEPVAVGGEIHPFYEKSPPGWFSDDLEIRSWGTEKGFLELPRAKIGFSGSNMAFRRSILEAYGGFPVEYGPIGDKFSLGEETILFNRLYKDHPLFWYDPAIRVKHLVTARKMNIWYRLSRQYLTGIVFARVYRENSADSVASKLRFLLYQSAVLPFLICKCLILPFRVRWWQSDWQRYFLLHAKPVARSIGFIKVVLGG